IPILISFSQAVEYCAVFTLSSMIISFEMKTKVNCILWSLLFKPNRFLGPLVIAIHILRFVLIVNLNNMKDVFYKQQSADKGIRTVKVIKTLTAPWFSIVTIIL